MQTLRFQISEGATAGDLLEAVQRRIPLLDDEESLACAEHPNTNVQPAALLRSGASYIITRERAITFSVKVLEKEEEEEIYYLLSGLTVDEAITHYATQRLLNSSDDQPISPELFAKIEVYMATDTGSDWTRVNGSTLLRKLSSGKLRIILPAGVVLQETDE